MNATLEIRARRRWLAFIAMFFVAQAGLWTWAIATVSSDASHAVVANYDARALDWDAQRSELEASAALGWVATVELERERVTVRIADRDGRPVEAELSLALFHKAEAARRTHVRMQAVAPGVWQGELALQRAGLFVVELEATRDAQRFTTTKTLDVP